MSIRILLQTTLLPSMSDDWTIARFAMLQQYLKNLTDDTDQALCHVTARDRTPNADGDDPVLSQLNRDQFDELWLFALDVGDGLSDADRAGIRRFHQQGGGILTTRDHQDMGLSMCGLTGIGDFHYFHSQQCDPDESRACRDDADTISITYPNYHSGANGDYQIIHPCEPVHELLKRPDSTTLQYFPAHPHEGGVGVAGYETAQVIATGVSKVTQRSFNLVVVSDRPSSQTDSLGRVVAQSTFHHFVDYNWNTEAGCPSFVEEPPSKGMQTNPQAIPDIHCYVRNLVLWLKPD
jgi:hypothetical protein